MRLSARGAQMLDSWLAGEPVDASAEAIKLQQRLLAAGLLHPVLEPVDRPDVGFVVPVFNDAVGLSATLQALRVDHADAPIVVVDDASDPSQADAIARAAAGHDAQLERHDVNQGPGSARNTGWRALPPEVAVVVFADSDVVPQPACVRMLLAHFDEPAIAAVAPRIRSQAGDSALDRYEAVESPLDLGDAAAVVRPGSSVPYVPSTLLVVRRAVLTELNGFEPSMRVGEDVDFIWRLLDHGGFVRYEPRALALHRNRSSWKAALRQRHGYGTAAATLDERHPGDVAPIELPAKTLLTWALAFFGGTPGVVAAGALGVYEANDLRKRLDDRVDDPIGETVRLVGMGHAHAGHWLARAVTRAWLPIVAAAVPFSAAARRVLVASALVPNLVGWMRTRPALNPVAYVAARLADDIAYCSGVWRGAVAERSFRTLLPRIASRGAVTDSS